MLSRLGDAVCRLKDFAARLTTCRHDFAAESPRRQYPRRGTSSVLQTKINILIITSCSINLVINSKSRGSSELTTCPLLSNIGVATSICGAQACASSLLVVLEPSSVSLTLFYVVMDYWPSSFFKISNMRIIFEPKLKLLREKRRTYLQLLRNLNYHNFCDIRNKIKSNSGWGQ